MKVDEKQIFGDLIKEEKKEEKKSLKKPVIITFAVIAALALITMIGVLLIFANPNGVFDEYPKIASGSNQAGVQTINIDFPFNGERVNGTVVLNAAPYLAAQKSAKTVRLYGDSGKDDDWQEKYYLAITNDPDLEDMYSKMTDFFKSYAASHGLTDDEYVELVTAYVQNIPYQTYDLNTKFPVETVVDNWGDCDDKSTLLAGLLSYAGFDSALFSYKTHMSAAVKSSSGEYIPIETTNPTFVGEVVSEQGVDLAKPEYVYKIGEGTKCYSASADVKRILAAEIIVQEKLSGLRKKLDEIDASLDWQLKEIQNGNTDMIGAYNANVKNYNQWVGTYNTVGKLYNTLRSSHNNRKGLIKLLDENNL